MFDLRQCTNFKSSTYVFVVQWYTYSHGRGNAQISYSPAEGLLCLTPRNSLVLLNGMAIFVTANKSWRRAFSHSVLEISLVRGELVHGVFDKWIPFCG